MVAGIWIWKNALLQLKHGRQKQETQGAGSRGSAGCGVCFQSPKCRGRSCWGSPKQEAGGQAGARRTLQRPGAPSQARYAPIQCPGLRPQPLLPVQQRIVRAVLMGSYLPHTSLLAIDGASGLVDRSKGLWPLKLRK